MPDRPVIAIVEDDRSVRRGIVDLVKAMGFEAETFERAAEFLQSSRVATASCLITDVAMPDITGLELLEYLRASGRSIPSIVITAFPQDADRSRALQAGAICYLAKPFTDNKLVECIHSALSSDRQSPGRS